MYIALLGRQPELSIAELERLFGHAEWFSKSAALVDAPLDVEQLGGSQKVGEVTLDLPTGNWQDVAKKVINHYSREWAGHEGKLTLGISAYNTKPSGRDIQRIGLTLKSKLKQRGVSVRLIPNQEAALSSATSHHNKLGLSDNKVELIIVSDRGRTIVAESRGAQNISALAARDQGRPKRDAFVGMLPPKLAQLMINLAAPAGDTPRVLDPFCGTGVLLQEVLLKGYTAYGTDLADKMIDYSRQNLDWIIEKYRLQSNYTLEQGDAMDAHWSAPIDAIATEAYLGQPFSAPPSPTKLRQVRDNCNHIIGDFLRNLHGQIEPGTPLCVAVPAWRGTDGRFTHLPLTQDLEKLGYARVELQTVKPYELLYHRPDQVVARELLVITRV